MKKRRKIIVVISIIVLVILIISFIAMRVTNVGIFSSNARNANGGAINPEDIKKGVTIAGATGKLEELDTSDATATPEDILAGKTAYVKGQKITGTATRPLNVETSYTTDSITIKVNSDDLGDNITYEYFINGESKEKTQNKEYTTGITLENKNPYVPSGFTHTEGTVDTGYVIKDTSLGNEFVWIPVKSGIYQVSIQATDSSGIVIAKSDEINLGISELTRTLKSTGVEYANWYEEEGSISDKKSIAYFKQSVAENAGFYMGRYEMGMPGQKSGDEPVLDFTNDARNIKGVPVCVAQVMPWTNIDYDVAKENIESMYNGEVQSAMLNSYARTTTFNWIGGTEGNYQDTFWPGSQEPLSFKGGYYAVNYYEEFGYGREENYILGEVFLGGAPSGESILLETGAKILNSVTNREIGFCANNIYDLGGNAGEWSTEMLKDDNSHRISGGNFQSVGVWEGKDNNSSPYQSGLTGDISTSSRPILYK